MAQNLMKTGSVNIVVALVIMIVTPRDALDVRI